MAPSSSSSSSSSTSSSSYVLYLLLILLCCTISTGLRTPRWTLAEDGYYYGSSSRNRRSINENKDLRFYSPWASLFNFSACRFGESPKGLRQMKRYLANFGYLPSSPSFSDSFDESFRDAILSYQHFFHLNTTGELDPSTLEKMVEPRCGAPDVHNERNSSSSSSQHGRNLYSFFRGNPSWPRTNSTLTYSYVSTSAVSIDEDVLRSTFSRAFSRWAEIAPFNFFRVDPTVHRSDLKIGFYKGEHGDGAPFDGELGTLAHAFAPSDGRCHLDAAETWAASTVDAVPENLLQSAVAVDLESVAMHEIGHLLGLGHSAVEEAIMYPTIKTRTRRVKLAQDDILGIQKLYETNP